MCKGLLHVTPTCYSLCSNGITRYELLFGDHMLAFCLTSYITKESPVKAGRDHGM